MRATWLCGIGLLLGLLTGCVPTNRPPRNYPPTPVPLEVPGVVYVGDSLYMDEAEVTNLNWLEYLRHIRKDSAEAFYQSQLPDTTAWQRIPVQQGSADPSINYYLRYPGFRYYPVVGVSYQQAINYCRWRSAKVQENLRAGELRKRRWRDYDVTVEYRLPTLAEWERAAAGGLDPALHPYGRVRPLPATRRNRRHLRWLPLTPRRQRCLDSLGISYQAGQREYTMEFAVLEKAYLEGSKVPFRCYPTWAFEVEYVYAYPPNPYGLYNTIGNVAELTATEGLARGGAFCYSIRGFTLKTDFPYDRPQAWLGFRCACTVRVHPRPAAL